MKGDKEFIEGIYEKAKYYNESEPEQEQEALRESFLKRLFSSQRRKAVIAFSACSVIGLLCLSVFTGKEKSDSLQVQPMSIDFENNSEDIGLSGTRRGVDIPDSGEPAFADNESSNSFWIQEASIIVTGTISNITLNQNVYIAELEVEDCVKGIYQKIINIYHNKILPEAGDAFKIIPGNAVGLSTEKADNDVLFKVGEDVLLCLKEGDEKGKFLLTDAYYAVYRFSEKNENGEKLYIGANQIAVTAKELLSVSNK